ncbi:MAG TPA: hypothetical protein VLB29_16950 [Nocardioidaceae bacterium]|nr:hypothetical protein [Nocardioidaceae bacterium]
MTEGRAPEQIAYTNRFVASPSTGRSMARAFVRHGLTMRSQVVFYAGFFALCVLMWMVLFDEDSASLGARVFWASVLAGVTTLALAVLVAVLGYVRTVRGARITLFPGAVVESGFGDGQMLLRNPLAESKISYRSVRTIKARGDFVFLRHRASPIVAIYPRALFPDDVIAHIRAAARQ